MMDLPTKDSAFTKEQRSELKKIVAESMDEYFRNKGTLGKHWLITLATVIGAIAVILGGFKAILGFLGFQHVAGIGVPGSTN